jgi:hypothetical protein
VPSSSREEGEERMETKAVDDEVVAVV